jgi:hypothetical protein
MANQSHIKFAAQISDAMESSAKQRGTGISKRSPEQIVHNILEGKAVIALTDTGDWAGFCYIQSWDDNQYVSNSGLIVSPPFRQNGLGRAIKKKVFELSRLQFPKAKIFGLTTSSAVMKINSEMGYEPVIYSEIAADEAFWAGCKSCVNYPILQSKEKKNCLCTAMLFDPLFNTKDIIHSNSITQNA